MPSQRRKFKRQLKHFPTFSSKTLLFVWLSWLLSSYCKFYNVDISMFWIGPSQYLNNFSHVLSIFAVISAYFKWSLELYLSHWRQIYLRSSWQRVWKALTWKLDNWHWQFHHWLLTHILSVNFQFCRKKLWNILKKKAKIHGKIYIWRRNMQTYILMFFKGFKYPDFRNQSHFYCNSQWYRFFWPQKLLVTGILFMLKAPLSNTV